MLLQNKKKKEKLEALKTMKIPVDKDLEQGLDLLEIDTGLHGHHTGFSFKKAVLDDSYIWELTIGVAHLPKRLKLSYEVHIILSPADYEIALEAQFDNLKKKQLEL